MPSSTTDICAARRGYPGVAGHAHPDLPRAGTLTVAVRSMHARCRAEPGHTLGSGAHDHEVRHLDARRLAGLPTIAGALCAPARDSTLVRLSP